MSVNQLKAGAVLNYVILSLNAVVGFIYTPFMLRMLGQSEYGIYSLAASIIAYLSMLDLGFGNAVIRYTAKFRAEGKIDEQYSMFGLFTVLYSLIGLIVIIIGVFFYFNIDSIFGKTLTTIELERTRLIVMLMVINLAVTFPLSIYGAIITAYENFIFLRVVQIVRILLSTAVLVALIAYGYKAVALVVAHTAFNIVTLGLNYFYCRKKIKIKLWFKRPDTLFLREISVYSFWIFLNAIMDRIYWSTGQFVLGATSGTKAISVFAVAIQLQGMYIMFSNGISGVFLPRVTSMVSKNCNAGVISDLFIKVGRIQYFVLSLILSGFIVFGRSFISQWAGPGYEETYVITLIFFVALIIPLMQNLGITILMARNQMKFRSLLYLGISLCSLVFQIPLSKYYGGVGCAVAIGVALLLGQGLIINVYYSWVQTINIPRFWREIIRMSIAPAAVTVLAVFVCSRISIDNLCSLVISVLVYTVLYVLSFFFFSMNGYERSLFVSPVMRLMKIK